MNPPLSLYIHFPWCESKCPYCDFNSHECQEIPEKQYLSALQQDMQTSLPQIWGRKVETVFIGGGTPSLLSPQAVEELLGTVRQLFQLQGACEITLEANPGTLQKEKLQAYAQAGVNRLSVGVQSFNDTLLSRLGRIHNAQQAEQCLLWAKEYFSNINADIMFALPGQNLQQAKQDVERVLQLGVNHISYYQLTLEPNTVFYSRPPKLPEEEAIMDMYEQGQQELLANGYPQYEVSAYSLENARCRHNLNYWYYGDYLGIGAGAHSKLSGPWDIKRIQKLKNPAHYMQRLNQGEVVSKETALQKNTIQLEFLMNALRLKEGFHRRHYEGNTGLPWAELLSLLQTAEQHELIDLSAERIVCSEKGYGLINTILQDYIQVGDV